MDSVLSARNLTRQLITDLGSVSESHIPKEIVGMIADYATDYSAALEELELDGGKAYRAKALDNVHNRKIANTVKAALISNDCDPVIKAEIFVKFSTGHDAERKFFQRLLIEIVQQGDLVILDNVNLRGSHFYNFDLTGMSAVNTDFTGVHLTDVHMPRAILTGAIFNRSTINAVDMRDTNLEEAKFFRTTVQNSNISGANVTNAMFLDAFFERLTVTNIKSNDPSLRKLVETSTFKSSSFITRGWGFPDSLWDFGFGTTAAIEIAVFTSGFGVDLRATRAMTL